MFRAVDELRNDPEVAEQLADGAAIAVVPLVMESGSLVRANLIDRFRFACRDR
jgi:hypothetical protein